jgi:hypothetical protein
VHQQQKTNLVIKMRGVLKEIDQNANLKTMKFDSTDFNSEDDNEEFFDSV